MFRKVIHIIIKVYKLIEFYEYMTQTKLREFK